VALIVVIGLVIAFLLAAALYGHDSRDVVRSKEHELAAGGVTWQDRLAEEQALADELAAALRNQARLRATQTSPAGIGGATLGQRGALDEGGRVQHARTKVGGFVK
jgi:hypothetical protein